MEYLMLYIIYYQCQTLNLYCSYNLVSVICVVIICVSKFVFDFELLGQTCGCNTFF